MILNINITDIELNRLINLHKMAVKEVSDIVAFYNKSLIKWPDEYKIQISVLKNSGEKLWNLIDGSNTLSVDLAVSINKLDMLTTQAKQLGLI